MKTVIKAIFSVLFSYIFLLYMKIPINGMIIIGVGIAFYKIWMTKKDFDRIDDKLSYIAFSLLLSISIVLSKHIHQMNVIHLQQSTKFLSTNFQLWI